MVAGGVLRVGYPFGLEIAGLNSNALGFGADPKNRKKYNGIERDTDLDLNIDEAFYRNLDPATGRWWQVDPKVEVEQESWSPYNSMSDNPIRYQDPLGDCAPCLVAEAVETGVAVYRAYSTAKAIESIAEYSAQRTAVENRPVVSMVIVTDSKGNPIALPEDSTTYTPALPATPRGYVASWTISDDDKFPRGELNPPAKPGNAPTFKKDGKAVEIHHKAQNPNRPMQEMHPSDHRGKGNDKKNHPNKSQPSKIDRKVFRKEVKEHWKREYPNGTKKP